MFVVEPVGKARAYGANRGPFGTPYIYLPPWKGKILEPPAPDRYGNFDYLRPSMPGFEAAHVFGCVRFTLDVWEGYLGQRLLWHFRDHCPRLEISILPEWDNAQYGYGFLEIGSQFEKDGRVLPFSLDFDVVAHEVGHAIIFSVLGVPSPGTEYPEYLGFQEAFSDCVSLIAAMHFPSVIESVLIETNGNLQRANRLARFSEFSPHRQIRSASNDRTMADFIHCWKDEHELSQPLTGAIFDILVDIFHEGLVARGILPRDVETLADIAEFDPTAESTVQHAFDRAFARNSDGFVEALLDARNTVGSYLAQTLWALAPDFLDYGDVARTVLAVDSEKSGGRFTRIISENFRNRAIGVLHAEAHLQGDAHSSHFFSARTLLPIDYLKLPKMSYRERLLLSKQTDSQ